MSTIRPGQFVEASVKVGGESKTAIAVVKRVVDNPDGSCAAHIDFGPGVTTDDGGSSTLVWRDVATLRPVGAPSGKAPLIQRSEQPRDKTTTGVNQAHTGQSTAKTAPNSTVTSTDDASLQAPAETGLFSTPDHPTSIDQAIWTLVAGITALLEFRRPLVSILFILIATLYNGLEKPHAMAARGSAPSAVSEASTTCLAVTELSEAAPLVFADFVHHGRLPGSVATFAEDLISGAFLKDLHEFIEHHQRKSTVTTAVDQVVKTALKKERGGKSDALPVPDSEVPKKQTKEKKRATEQPPTQTPVPQVVDKVQDSQSKPAASDAKPAPPQDATPLALPPTNAGAPKTDEGLHQKQTVQPTAVTEPVSPSVEPAVVQQLPRDAQKEVPPALPYGGDGSPARSDRSPAVLKMDLCGRTADLCLAVLALLVIGSTTAYPFVNPRVQLTTVATKFKGLAYITALLIVAFSALDSDVARSFTPRHEWLAMVYTHVIDVNTLTTFLLSHVSFNIVLGVIGTLVAGVVKPKKSVV